MSAGACPSQAAQFSYRRTVTKPVEAISLTWRRGYFANLAQCPELAVVLIKGQQFWAITTVARTWRERQALARIDVLK